MNDDVSDSSLFQCLAILQALMKLPEDQVPDSEDLEKAISALYKRLRKRRRRRSGAQRKRHDRDAVRSIADAKEQNANETALDGRSLPVEFLHRSRICYCCNTPYRKVHSKYHLLCVECGDFCESKRFIKANLNGFQAIVTGGRVKIGFEIAKRLLNCGATVHVTTRFPKEAAIRYSSLPEFEQWSDRLRIHGLDFRRVSDVFQFARHYGETESHLDILVNNAAQSVKRSTQWHRQLYNLENNASLNQQQRHLIVSGNLVDLATPDESGANLMRMLDYAASSDALAVSTNSIDNLQSRSCLPYQADDDDIADQRDKTSWNSRLAETPAIELLEVFLVNSNAPALLVQQLLPAFKRSTEDWRFIVNVSGADSMFQLQKSGFHPHVNMSKAAANMMTHTCARDFFEQSILLNSVDTGWITVEGSVAYREQKKREGFVPPYDHLDGAVRVLDPIFGVLNKTSEPEAGNLYRNFKRTNW